MIPIDRLFEEQIQRWPLLVRGMEGLANAETKRVRMDWFDVYIRHIPHRIASTTAAVDREAVSRRPCFLCRDNLPPEEKGLAFGAEYTVYCNPYPILERHLTIVHRDHRPQQLRGEAGPMLDLAQALPECFLVYNGAQSGASAPDHMHFQACSRRLFPIERDLAGKTGPVVEDYGRKVIVLRNRDRSDLISQIDGLIEGFSDAMVNVAAFHESGEWTAYIFPRRKHRPDVFYSGELTVSPATIDLCGIFVVPVGNDFHKITGEDVANIYREVSLW